MDLFNTKKVNDLKNKLENLQNDYNQQSQDFSNFMTQTYQQQQKEETAFNPNFNFDVNAQELLNGGYQNYVNKWLVRTSQFGADYSQNSMTPYLLTLEQARYFKHRVIFTNVEDERLNFLLYEALYHAALNGIVGLLVNGNGKYLLVNVTDFEYDLDLNLTSCNIQPVNVFNAANWNHATQRISGRQIKNLCILKQNEENFGLWVTNWEANNQIKNFFTMLFNQTVFLSKKIGIQDNIDVGNKTQIYQQLINPSLGAIILDDLNRVKVLNTPDVNINDFFNLIVNYQNYTDYHFAGIRTKDVDVSNKSRDIVANQGIVSAQASKKEQSQSIYLDKFLSQINTLLGSSIDYEDSNIFLDNELEQNSNQQDKITAGAEDKDGSDD